MSNTSSVANRPPEDGRRGATMRRRFFAWMMVAIGLGVAIPLWVGHQQAQYLTSLESGIERLQREIGQRNDQVADFKDLKPTIINVLTHKAVVEFLQERRAEAVSILNFFAEQTPADVVLTELRREGRLVRVRGMTRPGANPAGHDAAGHLVRRMASQRNIFASVETGAASTAADARSFELTARLAPVAGAPERNEHPAAEGHLSPPSDTAIDVASDLPLGFIFGGLLLVLLGTVVLRRRPSRTAPALKAASGSEDFGVLALLGIFLGTFLATSAGVIYPANEKIVRTQGVEVNLRDDLIAANRLAINQVQYRAQVPQLGQIRSELRRRLPPHFDTTSDMEVLDTLATKAGIARPDLYFGEEKTYDFFARMPLWMTASGSFRQVGDFFAAVGRLDRIAEIGNFSLKVAAGKLAMDAEIVTYRILSERELADQRRDAR